MFIMKWINKFKAWRKRKKKIKELQKRDPFVY